MNDKDIDLCGLGNGLVDLIYEVSFEEFENLPLPLKRGEMILAEPNVQKSLIEVLKGKAYKICSGGSAANSIIAFSQLGGKSAYHTVVGDDEFGKFYVDEFLNLGIYINAPMINEPTGTCLVLITPDSERTMITSLGATAHFGPEHITPEFIKRAKWVYLEGYKFTAEKSTQALFYAIDLGKRYGSKVALTLSDVFVIQNYYDQVLKALEYIDLLFCNEAEALALTETKVIDEAVRRIKMMVPNFVITRGSEGSIAFISGKQYSFEAFPTQAVDTTGAGDMYAGAFLFGLIKKSDVGFAGRLASLSASYVVSQFGARLQTDHKSLVKQIEESKL
jgi:sugar/nucleoside kinase (ribokinase family)